MYKIIVLTVGIVSCNAYSAEMSPPLTPNSDQKVQDTQVLISEAQNAYNNKQFLVALDCLVNARKLGDSTALKALERFHEGIHKKMAAAEYDAYKNHLAFLSNHYDEVYKRELFGELLASKNLLQ